MYRGVSPELPGPLGERVERHQLSACSRSFWAPEPADRPRRLPITIVHSRVTLDRPSSSTDIIAA